MSAVVFISHSSQDHHAAIKVCDALERRGIGCWLASRDIGPGENFQESIVHAIRSTRAMVLVFTGHANNSNEIKKEIALASQNGVVVIPLRLEDVLPSDAFLYELSTRQWIDAFEDWDRAIGRLADQIRVIAGEAVTAPATAPSVTHAARRQNRALLAAAGLAVVVVGAGLIYWFVAGASLRSPAASATAAAPAAVSDISGKWVTAPLANPYDPTIKTVLRFEFTQSGDALFGTVNEKSDTGTFPRNIRGGRVTGGSIAFFTEGETTGDGGKLEPMKEQYRGTLAGTAIEFIRQNDVASGGVAQKFTAKRQ
jgi:hypothetical protein